MCVCVCVCEKVGTDGDRQKEARNGKSRKRWAESDN